MASSSQVRSISRDGSFSARRNAIAPGRWVRLLGPARASADCCYPPASKCNLVVQPPCERPITCRLFFGPLRRSGADSGPLSVR